MAWPPLTNFNKPSSLPSERSTISSNVILNHSLWSPKDSPIAYYNNFKTSSSLVFSWIHMHSIPLPHTTPRLASSSINHVNNNLLIACNCSPKSSLHCHHQMDYTQTNNLKIYNGWSNTHLKDKTNIAHYSAK